MGLTTRAEREVACLLRRQALVSFPLFLDFPK